MAGKVDLEHVREPLPSKSPAAGVLGIRLSPGQVHDQPLPRRAGQRDGGGCEVSWMAVIYGTRCRGCAAGRARCWSGIAPAKGPRRCGIVLSTTLTVEGPITCKQARTFARCVLTHRCRGVFHGSPNGPRSQWYTTCPNGWTCGATFQGVTSCRHGKGRLTLLAI
jgi:hypothetical protein